MSVPELGFGILGPVQMTSGTMHVAVGTPKQRVVLAMLVVNRNRAVGVDALIDAVWGEPAPSGARATLHSYVSNIRRLIAATGAEPHRILVSTPPGYRLSISDTQCDVGRFAAEQQAGARAAAAGRFDDACRHLAAALDEWRGRVLEDIDDFDFVAPLAQALTEEKVVVQTARAEAEIARGHAHVVLAELETLAAENPYREPVWTQLITAYYLTDRQSDALNAYHRLKTTLGDDLGIDPNPTIQALYERILRQEPLDVQKTARAAAEDTIIAFEHDSIVGSTSTAALRDCDGQLYPLAGAATRIGRSPDNDVVLTDAKVSRHHAVINNTGTGFSITDVGSANGVYVAGERIRASAALHNGDTIRIGEQEFIFDAHAALS